MRDLLQLLVEFYARAVFRFLFFQLPFFGGWVMFVVMCLPDRRPRGCAG